MKRRRTVGLCLSAVFVMSAVATAPASATSQGAMAWGGNFYGQLGDGTFSGPEKCGTEACSKTPVAVSRLMSGVKAVSAGYHSLARLSNGTVMAWGSNSYGQLGDGTEISRDVPVAVGGLGGVGAVSAGGGHSLAALSNGTVMAWGRNEFGELGDGTTTNRNVPVALSGLSGAVAISGGGIHSLALLDSGAVVAWGSNGVGQLGNGTTTGPEACAEGRPCSKAPVAVSGLKGVVAVSAGGSHSLGLLSSGKVWAWGNNGSGQLGDGTTTSRDVPVEVSGLSGVVAVSAGLEHSLALLSNGTVMAWGGNRFGQLGHGSGPEICGGPLEPCSKTPVAVTALSGVRTISAGSDHSLALLESGAVMAWGLNQFGQLGDGTTVESSVPVPVSELSGVSTISAGEFHSLAYSPPPPTITAISPSEGAKTGGTSVTITGTGFEGATGVRFGSANATSFKVNSESSITARSPAGSGTVDVTVTTPWGTSATNSADRFYYARPTVKKLSPRRGPAVGGTSVIITGTNFVGVTVVKFGSSAATFKFNSATSITADSPAGTKKTVVDVTVTTPSGTSAISKRDRFRYRR